jgi:hypothetical protein
LFFIAAIDMTQNTFHYTSAWSSFHFLETLYAIYSPFYSPAFGCSGFAWFVMGCGRSTSGNWLGRG